MVVVPQAVVETWDSTPGDPDVDEPTGWGDYERACEVDDHLGIVDVEGTQALVLGDMPDMTTYLPERQLFVRWQGAESEAWLLGSIDRALDMAIWQCEVRWTVPGPALLFDSAWPGADLSVHQPGNHLAVDLLPGTYRVRHSSVEPDTDTMVGLVQLELLAD